jgi:hypothetical protein
MKSLKTANFAFRRSFYGVLQSAAVDQKSGGGNAIPYPLKEWKGVQGKTLADSKPDFIGQPKAPDGAPMYSSSCWMMAVIRVRHPTGAS